MKSNMWIAFSLMLGSQFSFAAEVHPGLTCASDLRPVDGCLEQIDLNLNAAGKYDVVYTTAFLGLGPEGPIDPTPEVTLLATNLKCDFSNKNKIVLSCFKDADEENEKTNSWFSSTHVLRHRIDLFEGEGTIENIEIKVISPLMPKKDAAGSFPKNSQVLTFSTGDYGTTCSLKK